MVTLTPSAAAELRSLADASGIPGAAFRLFLTEGGCCGPGFGLDVVPKSEANDVAVAGEGATLYLQKEAAELLEGVVIDFDGGFQLRGLKSSGCRG